MSTTITKKWYYDGQLTDPTSIKLSDPTGTYGVRRKDTQELVIADGASMVKISTGIYQYTFDDPAADLIYEYYIEIVYDGETYYFEGQAIGGGGAVLPADNALITLAEIKEWLNLTGSDDNDFLQRSINEWSDTIETRLGRTILSANYTDEVHDGGKRAVTLDNFPVTAISSIAVDGTALGTDDYTLKAKSGIIRMASGYNFAGGPGDILVSYTAGYTTAPGDLKRAVTQLVALEFYLSGHGRKALAKRSESTGDGSTTYERGPEDQEKIIRGIVRRYGRR